MYKVVAASLEQGVKSYNSANHFVDCLDLSERERALYVRLKKEIAKGLIRFVNLLDQEEQKAALGLPKKQRTNEGHFFKLLLNDYLWLESGVGFYQYDIDKKPKTIQNLKRILDEGLPNLAKEKIATVLTSEDKVFCVDALFSSYHSFDFYDEGDNLEEADLRFHVDGHFFENDEYFQYVCSDQCDAGTEYIKVLPFLNLDFILENFGREYYGWVERYYHSSSFKSLINGFVQTGDISKDMIYTTEQGVLVRGIQNMMHRRPVMESGNRIHYVDVFRNS